jgi:hypothetical protein
MWTHSLVLSRFLQKRKVLLLAENKNLLQIIMIIAILKTPHSGISSLFDLGFKVIFGVNRLIQLQLL